MNQESDFGRGFFAALIGDGRPLLKLTGIALNRLRLVRVLSGGDGPFLAARHYVSRNERA